MHIKYVAVAASVAMFVCSATSSALSIGQKDTFENGTTQGWQINLLGNGSNANQPVNVPTGGPTGLDDNYLLMTSTGQTGTGGKLVALNPAQWAGNYLGLGINLIGMQVNNFGNTDLFLRLLFEDPLGAPPVDEAITKSILVPARSGWRQILFPIGPADLILEHGSITTLLQNTTILRIFHNQEAEGPDEANPIAARLGVDNVEAIRTPEPTSALLLATGLAALWRQRTRR